MAEKRRLKGTFLEGKASPRRSRVKFQALQSSGAKRVSLLESRRAPVRSRVALLANRLAKSRRRFPPS
jgi:hypothetical protein